MTPARYAPLRALIACSLAATLASTSFAADYQITDLGSLGNPRGSGAVSLNGRGTAAGYSFVAGSNNVHAMLNRYGEVVDLGTLGGTQSLAHAVNHAGWVVGWSYRAGSFVQAATLWRDGEILALGDFGGNRSVAQDLNEAGLIVGSAFTAGGEEHAFWWQDGVMSDMGTLGGTTSRAYDVNERGVIVGMASPSLGRFHAFVAKPNEPLQDLGTLGGEATHAYAINDLDHIVGWGYLDISSPASRGFFMDESGKHHLPTLGGLYSSAFGMNNLDHVVGAATNADEQQFAVMWRNLEVINLNSVIPPTVGWILTRAWDIDDQGAIVGEGLYQGEPRAFLLTPSETSGAPDPSRPTAVTFAGATPNPVRGSSNFTFALPAAAHVRLELFDASGRRVRALADGPHAAGTSRIAWDGADDRGARAGAGLYWARLTTPSGTHVRRVAVLQ